jgi:hypothetical protein
MFQVSITSPQVSMVVMKTATWGDVLGSWDEELSLIFTFFYRPVRAKKVFQTR